ncbi:hypothetical protein [Poseidonibacter ostreae]|uniref:Uncharacterized protein n=1 Tax=Poseidonibacter ostreae TaxID=2654171 RepID=A0A6L4WWV4_9BACT|nr:hypothetical protein [Poseidonibacter ostreae]KAB7891361.1 hypothetical protein GBG19_00565 [Poseidonibacter ostreae]
MSEFMDKVINNQKKKLIKEISFTCEEIKNMTDNEIKQKAISTSSNANWKHSDASRLFEHRILKIQAPTMIKRARG